MPIRKRIKEDYLQPLLYQQRKCYFDENENINVNQSKEIEQSFFRLLPDISEGLVGLCVGDIMKNLLLLDNNYTLSISQQQYLKLFIKDLLKKSKSSFSIFKLSIYYLYKLSKSQPKNKIFKKYIQKRQKINNPLIVAEVIYVVVLMLAFKYIEDNCYYTSAWAKVTGIDSSIIHSVEVIILTILDHRLYISNEEFEKFSSEIIGKINKLKIDIMQSIRISYSNNKDQFSPLSETFEKNEINDKKDEQENNHKRKSLTSESKTHNNNENNNSKENETNTIKGNKRIKLINSTTNTSTNTETNTKFDTNKVISSSIEHGMEEDYTLNSKPNTYKPTISPYQHPNHHHLQPSNYTKNNVTCKILDGPPTPPTPNNYPVHNCHHKHESCLKGMMKSNVIDHFVISNTPPQSNFSMELDPKVNDTSANHQADNEEGDKEKKERILSHPKVKTPTTTKTTQTNTMAFIISADEDKIKFMCSENDVAHTFNRNPRGKVESSTMSRPSKKVLKEGEKDQGINNEEEEEEEVVEEEEDDDDEYEYVYEYVDSEGEEDEEDQEENTKKEKTQEEEEDEEEEEEEQKVKCSRSSPFTIKKKTLFQQCKKIDISKSSPNFARSTPSIVLPNTSPISDVASIFPSLSIFSQQPNTSRDIYSTGLGGINALLSPKPSLSNSSSTSTPYTNTNTTNHNNSNDTNNNNLNNNQKQVEKNQKTNNTNNINNINNNKNNNNNGNDNNNNGNPKPNNNNNNNNNYGNNNNNNNYGNNNNNNNNSNNHHHHHQHRDTNGNNNNHINNNGNNNNNSNNHNNNNNQYQNHSQYDSSNSYYHHQYSQYQKNGNTFNPTIKSTNSIIISNTSPILTPPYVHDQQDSMINKNIYSNLKKNYSIFINNNHSNESSGLNHNNKNNSHRLNGGSARPQSHHISIPASHISIPNTTNSGETANTYFTANSFTIPSFINKSINTNTATTTCPLINNNNSSSYLSNNFYNNNHDNSQLSINDSINKHNILLSIYNCYAMRNMRHYQL